MDFEYIDIEKDNLPYRFEIELGAEIFEMEFRYNDLGDFFTVDLLKDEETLVIGEKIVYGVPLFKDINKETLPAPTIIPLDESGNQTRVSFENLNETVFLRVVNDL